MSARRTFFTQVLGGLLAAVGVKKAEGAISPTDDQWTIAHEWVSMEEIRHRYHAMNDAEWTPPPPDFWKRGPEFE